MNEKEQEGGNLLQDDSTGANKRGGAGGGAENNTSSANELLLLSNANTPTDSTSSPEELMQQRQIYSKGFLDALRVIQNANNFEFRPATSPIMPPLGTPGAGGTAITPATANDMHQIMLSLLGTPVTTSTGTSSTGNNSTTNSTTSSGAAPPLPTTPTLLSSPTLALSDSDVLKLYASTVLPGPPLASLHLPPSTNATNNNTNNEPIVTREHMPAAFNDSLISAAVAAAAASTSRPDKLNLPPPQMMDNNMVNSSDDSDSGMGYSNMRSTSRNMHGREMSMDDQERKKLDRKRARNRQAATKCRQKKMDRIRELEEQVTSEKARAARLNNEISQLQSVLSAYREAVSNHQTRGCRAS